MKNLLLLLIIGLAAYGGYSMWNNHREAAPPPPQVADAKTEEDRTPLKQQPTSTPAPESPKAEPEKPKAEPEVPVPAAPVKRLAPEGVFYAIQAFSVTTDDGIRGIRAGTPVRLIKDNGATFRVADGKEEFDVQRAFLTNDLDIAAQASGQQAATQAKIAELHEKEQAKAAANEERNAAVAAGNMATAQRNIAVQNLRNRDAGLAVE